MTLTTWRDQLQEAMDENEDPGPVIAYAPDEDGFVFTWTETRVYFPVLYDGDEWLASAPRNPPEQP